MDEGRLVISAEPEPVPSGFQVAPPLSLANSPPFATPAITVSESGTVESRVRLPHSDGMLARLPVAFTHFGDGAGPVSMAPATPVDPALPAGAPAAAPAPAPAPPVELWPAWLAAPPTPAPAAELPAALLSPALPPAPDGLPSLLHAALANERQKASVPARRSPNRNVMGMVWVITFWPSRSSTWPPRSTQKWRRNA